MIYPTHLAHAIDGLIVPFLLDATNGLLFATVDAAICEVIEHPVSHLAHSAK